MRIRIVQVASWYLQNKLDVICDVFNELSNSNVNFMLTHPSIQEARIMNTVYNNNIFLCIPVSTHDFVNNFNTYDILSNASPIDPINKAIENCAGLMAVSKIKQALMLKAPTTITNISIDVSNSVKIPLNIVDSLKCLLPFRNDNNSLVAYKSSAWFHPIKTTVADAEICLTLSYTDNQFSIEEVNNAITEILKLENTVHEDGTISVMVNEQWVKDTAKLFNIKYELFSATSEDYINYVLSLVKTKLMAILYIYDTVVPNLKIPEEFMYI